MYQRGQQRGFTIIELLVVISIISFIMAIFLPSLASARRSSERLENANNLRSLQAGMILFGEDNNSYYPGMDSNGTITAYQTYSRYQLLFEGDYASEASAVSPLETADKTVWDKTGNVGTSNYSYSMTSIRTFSFYSFDSNARNEQWRTTSNSQSPVMTDRAIRNWSGFSAFYIKSIHTNPVDNTYDWQGNVVWNDNHVTWEDDSTVDSRNGDTKYIDDDLFRNHPDWFYRTSSRLLFKVEDDVYMSANTSFGGASNE